MESPGGDLDISAAACARGRTPQLHVVLDQTSCSSLKERKIPRAIAKRRLDPTQDVLLAERSCATSGAATAYFFQRAPSRKPISDATASVCIGRSFIELST